MRLTWELEGLTRNLWREIAYQYGVSLYWGYVPHLCIYHDKKDDHCGWWWHVPPVVCGVNVANCDSMQDIVETMIEEYQHHLQDLERTDEEQYEAEAKAVAKRDAWMFLVRIT